MERIKTFENFTKNLLGFKKEKINPAIDSILKTQGTRVDQREDKIIYTLDELESMKERELLRILANIHHPKGRSW